MARGFLFDEGDELITRKTDVSVPIAHLSSESVEVTIDDDTYQCYPLDKTYKDLLEYPSPIYITDETGVNVYYPMGFQSNASVYDGYRYKVTFNNIESDDLNNPIKTIILYAESETGTLYFFPQE